MLGWGEALDEALRVVVDWSLRFGLVRDFVLLLDVG